MEIRLKANKATCLAAVTIFASVLLPERFVSKLTLLYFTFGALKESLQRSIRSRFCPVFQAPESFTPSAGHYRHSSANIIWKHM